MRCHGDPSLPVEGWLCPTPLLMQSLRTSLRLCWPAGPLRTPRSGLKQVRVLPTAIAHLWEPLAVNSHSVTSFNDLSYPRSSPDKGEHRLVLCCSVLLVYVRATTPVWGVDGTRGGNACSCKLGDLRVLPVPVLRLTDIPSCHILGTCTARNDSLRPLWPTRGAVGRHLSSFPDSDFVGRSGYLLRLMHRHSLLLLHRLLGEPQNARVQKPVWVPVGREGKHNSAKLLLWLGNPLGRCFNLS